MEKIGEVFLKNVEIYLEQNKKYHIDVDQETTFSELKNIISNAAHLHKTNFILQDRETRYDNEYNDLTLQKIFPNNQKINLLCIKSKNKIQNDKEILIKYILQKCDIHSEFFTLFCITCKKSICSKCIYQKTHDNHKIIDKEKILGRIEKIMDEIFPNEENLKLLNPQDSNYTDSINFEFLVTTYFKEIKESVNFLERKIISSLEFFREKEIITENNAKNNIETLKNYCISGYINFKNNIIQKNYSNKYYNINFDDQKFYNLYKKIELIKRHKNDICKNTIKSYEKINKYFIPFKTEVESLLLNLENYIKIIFEKTIFPKFVNIIEDNALKEMSNMRFISEILDNSYAPSSKKRNNSFDNTFNKKQDNNFKIMKNRNSGSTDTAKYKNNKTSSDNSYIPSPCKKIFDNNSIIISSETKAINTLIKDFENKIDLIGKFGNTKYDEISSFSTNFNDNDGKSRETYLDFNNCNIVQLPIN